MKPITSVDSYLGAPLCLGQNKKAAFAHLIQWVAALVKGWKSKLLSQPGRTTLIKSVTSAIPTYQMSCFLLPKTISKSLNALQRDFWWGKDTSTKKGLYLRNWKSMCIPTAMGGLGIRDIDTMNLAAISRMS